MVGKRKQDVIVDARVARKKQFKGIEIVVAKTSPQAVLALSKTTPFKSSRGIVAIERLQPNVGTTILFGLPRELRDKVYHELWKDGPMIKQRYGRHVYNVTYGRPHIDSWPVATYTHPWLLTNKQVLHEGIQQLHQHSYWHMFDYLERKIKRRDYIFPLLTPSHARTVYVRLNSMRSTLDINLKSTHKMVQKICMDPKASVTKEIHVVVYCEGGPFGPSLRPYRCDLSPLENLEDLTKLERFVLTIKGPRHLSEYRRGARNYAHHTESLEYGRLVEELKRLAKRLIHGESTFTASSNQRIVEVADRNVYSPIRIEITQSTFSVTKD